VVFAFLKYFKEVSFDFFRRFFYNEKDYGTEVMYS